VNLTLHFAFAERICTREHPTEHCVVLNGRSLRVSKAEQVGVRPTITLLILHRLVREVIGTAIHIHDDEVEDIRHDARGEFFRADG
jgi:hypothetical protein